GDLTTADSLLEQALGEIRPHGDGSGRAYILCSLGHLALVRGDYARAASLQMESLSIRREVDTGLATVCVDELAMIAAAMGQVMRAARLFAAADAERARRGALPWPLTQHDRRIAISRVKAGLGESEFDLAWESGSALNFDSAIDDAAGLLAR